MKPADKPPTSAGAKPNQPDPELAADLEDELAGDDAAEDLEEEQPATPTRATIRVPRMKRGEMVLVHCMVAPGPVPGDFTATVEKIHADGALDLRVGKADRRTKDIHLERVPYGVLDSRPLHVRGPWWEMPPPPAKSEKAAPKK